MKLIFKIGGSDYFTEKETFAVPQIGWTVKIYEKRFRVENITRDYDRPEDDEALIIDLVNLEVIQPKPSADLNTVTVERVWKQNANSLSAGKSYEVIQRIDRGHGEKFAILDDNGKLKWYKSDNLQFKQN